MHCDVSVEDDMGSGREAGEVKPTKPKPTKLKSTKRKPNPHGLFTAISPPGRENRQWRCDYCHAKGLLDDLRKTECTYVYPLCKYCGQAPECAADCAGIMAILSSPDVYVVGSELPKVQKRKSRLS